MPRVSHLINNNDHKELSKLMIKVGRYTLAIVGLIVIGFAIVGENFILLWAGEDYRLVYWIVLIILVPQSITGIQSVGGVILQAKNRLKHKTILLFTMSIFNIFLLIILISYFGVIGAGLAISITTLIFKVIGLNIIYRYEIKLNLWEYFSGTLKGFLPVMILTSIIASFTLLIPGDGWVYFLFRVLIITTIYTILLLILGFNDKEKAELRIVVDKFKKKIRLHIKAQ